METLEVDCCEDYIVRHFQLATSPSQTPHRTESLFSFLPRFFPSENLPGLRFDWI